MYELYAGLHFNHRLFIDTFESIDEATDYARHVARTVAPGHFIIKGDDEWDVPGACMEIRVEEDGSVMDVSDRDAREGIAR
jgi:hypothetical protein